MKIQKSKKYLIDTNILIYSVSKNISYSKDSKDLITDLLQNSYDVNISTQNLLEFRRVTTHKKFPNPLNPKELDVSLRFWLENFNLIYAAKSTWLEYLKLEQKYNPVDNDVFDLWLAATMLANGITKIITVNTKHFSKIKEVEAINPFV